MERTDNRPVDLLVAGRAGIDLNTASPGFTFSEIPYFTKSVGGSPANIAQGAARLGLKTAFLGKVARDGMGEFIKKTFDEAGIDTSGIVFDASGARNCLALTEILSPGQSGAYQAADGASFHHGTYLYREHTADLLLEPSEVNRGLIEKAKIVLLSGTAFSQSPSRETMFEILRIAKSTGVLTALDIDYRPFGWESREETARVMEQAVSQCDLVIGNREEFNALEVLSMPDNRDNARSAQAILDLGASLVIVKDGPRGSAGYLKDGSVTRCGVIPTNAVKTFGSGDAYAAGLLYGILTWRGLLYSMRLGTACASLALTGISCAPSMPDFETAQAHLQAHLSELEAEA